MLINAKTPLIQLFVNSLHNKSTINRLEATAFDHRPNAADKVVNKSIMDVNERRTCEKQVTGSIPSQSGERRFMMTLGKFFYTVVYATVTKQYNLVLINGR